MKIGFVSLGCPKNLVDSEVMMGLAREAGHSLTHDAADADVLVVNTCAFIDAAKKESIDAILEMAEQKKSGQCQRLVVTGCLAERYREELRREIPEVDAVLGTGDVPAIVGALEGRGEGNSTPRAIPVVLRRRSEMEASPRQLWRGPSRSRGEAEASAHNEQASPRQLWRDPSGSRGASKRPDYLYDDRTPRQLATPAHFAYVKIAEGCNYKCAFCIIPRLRGAYRSRPADSIVREARALAGRGVRELLLVSQDTTYYGIDREERGGLPRLLRQLNQVEGLDWIRLLYLYPTTVTTETLTAMAECDKVCKYVDLPLQHASDSVLRRMRRPGTRAGYERLIDKIRRLVPGVTLRTTFIVGFPGETDEEFAELCDFVVRARFDHVGVFTYSHEEGTPAARLADGVPHRVKEQRRRRLMGLQKRMVSAANRARIGQLVRVMVDGPSAEHELVLKGRLAGQAPEIDPVVYLSDVDPSTCAPGQLVDAEVVAARGYDLVVRPLPPAEAA